MDIDENGKYVNYKQNTRKIWFYMGSESQLYTSKDNYFELHQMSAVEKFKIKYVKKWINSDKKQKMQILHLKEYRNIMMNF